jgi:hypothetical protein
MPEKWVPLARRYLQLAHARAYAAPSSRSVIEPLPSQQRMA